MSLAHFEAIYGMFSTTKNNTVKKHLKIVARQYFNELFDVQADPNTLTKDEVRAGCSQGKIPAIKMYRERTGRGLKECKDIVEDYFKSHFLAFKGYDTQGNLIKAP